MDRKNKFNDLSPALIDNSIGELLVIEISSGDFFIASETEFDSLEAEEKITCEMLDPVEIKDRIMYYRFNPSKYKTSKRRELEAPFTTNLPDHLKD